MTSHNKPHHEVLECFQADCEQSGQSYSVLKLSNLLPPVGDITFEDSEQRKLIPFDGGNMRFVVEGSGQILKRVG